MIKILSTGINIAFALVLLAVSIAFVYGFLYGTFKICLRFSTVFS